MVGAQSWLVGEAIEDYLETATDEELQGHVLDLMKRLHAVNEKPPDRSMLQVTTYSLAARCWLNAGCTAVEG